MEDFLNIFLPVWEKKPILYDKNDGPAPLTQFLHVDGFLFFCGYVTLSIQSPPGKPPFHNVRLLFEAAEALENPKGKKIHKEKFQTS